MAINLRRAVDRLRGGDSELSEVGNGVFESRRRWLGLALASGAALVLPCEVSAQALSKPSDAAGLLAWDDFLKQANPNAVELHKNSTARGQDAYLFWIASMAARLDTATTPRAKLAPFANLVPVVETGPAYFGRPFFVIEWRLAPNAYLPPHNHPNISVCTICTEGEANLRNFEISGPAPVFSSSERFVVRETHHEILTPGRINLVSAVRDNIHSFQAGTKGARGIDITTYHGPDQTFAFLAIEKKPRDAASRTYDATWKPR